ncbi:MAG: hypothetical protein OEL81_06355 [Nitrosopumilus sp.]|nr:hypothetical protein [Nitrosopumilus sp.]
MARDDWDYIQIPKAVSEQIQREIDRQHLKDYGYAKPKDVVLDIIRKWLENQIGKSGPHVVEKHTFTMNIKKFKKKIKFTLFQEDITCQECKSTDCIHALTVWTDMDIRKELEEGGINLPNGDKLKKKQELLEMLN